MRTLLSTIGLAFSLACVPFVANAGDILDPTPVAQQSGGPAVDGVNYKLSIVGGGFDRNVLDTAGNMMFVGSVATPIPYLPPQYGAQLDLGVGIYDGDFTSAAAGLHLFWRDPSVGLLGIYGDWGYVDPEHAGRTGVEAAVYNGQWSLDIFAGIQYGQHVETRFVDEVDVSYYFNDNLRGSIGHRLISRGHVANIAFEQMLEIDGYEGVSAFGEFEAGQDSYVAAWGGFRYSFGSGNSQTLIDRDRRSDPIVRIPRNLASVTQCGNLDVVRPKTSFRSEMKNLCDDEDAINAASSTGITKK